MIKNIKDVRYLEDKLSLIREKALKKEITEKELLIIEKEFDKLIGDPNRYYTLNDLSEKTKKVIKDIKQL